VSTIRSLRRAAESVIHPEGMTTAPGRTWATSWRLLADVKGAQPRWARIHWTPPWRLLQLRVLGQSALSRCQPSHWGLPHHRRRRRCPFTRPHSSQRMRSRRGAGSYSHQSTSWQVRRPPVSARQASSSMASLVAARRALTSPRRPYGFCMLSKCYSARERPASWARRPLCLRTRAPRPRSYSGPSGRRTAALALQRRAALETAVRRGGQQRLAC
jgi:hypothetical protein